jgi:DNA-binding NtrC family response regulator
MARILVVDDKPLMRESMALTLRRAGHDVAAAENGQAALSALAGGRFELVVTDLKMDRLDGVGLLQKVRTRWPDVAVVLVTAFGTVDVAVRAMKAGAFDFLQKPFKAEHLTAVVDRALEHRRLKSENEALRTQASGDGLVELVGASAGLEQVRRQIEQVAPSASTVLIHGESGAGKEVVARRVHALSPRAERPMLCLNCAALSAGLLESELFGHERGAFTGADRLRKGRFELADGGTLLLDEVSEIEPRLQAKLLRVLEERQFERVGSSDTLSVDVRVLATTNRDLPSAVAEGAFREDLYYRLNVVPIFIPPLRDRREDIPLLAEHFVSRFSRGLTGAPVRLTDACLRLLSAYDWPGNVRELQHLIERACVLGLGPEVSASDLEPWLTGPLRSGGGPRFAPGTSLEVVEREMIRATLEKMAGHRARTADALGISVRTLGMKIKAYHLAEVGRAGRGVERQKLPVAAQ